MKNDRKLDSATFVLPNEAGLIISESSAKLYTSSRGQPSKVFGPEGNIASVQNALED